MAEAGQWDMKRKQITKPRKGRKGREYVQMMRVANRVPQDAHLQLNNAVELVGKVQQDLSIKVFQATDFGSSIGALIPTFLYSGQDRYRKITNG